MFVRFKQERFKSMHYVCHRQGRGKSRKNLMRETPEKSELSSESAQQSTIKNAKQVLLGTQ